MNNQFIVFWEGLDETGTGHDKGAFGPFKSLKSAENFATKTLAQSSFMQYDIVELQPEPKKHNGR